MKFDRLVNKILTEIKISSNSNDPEESYVSYGNVLGDIFYDLHYQLKGDVRLNCLEHNIDEIVWWLYEQTAAFTKDKENAIHFIEILIEYYEENNLFDLLHELHEHARLDLTL
jgi:hypothetical protein